MDGVPFLFNRSFPEAHSQENKTPTVRTVGVLRMKSWALTSYLGPGDAEHSAAWAAEPGSRYC